METCFRWDGTNPVNLECMSTKPVLLIHGGAWAMPDDAVAAHEDGIANALAAGRDPVSAHDLDPIEDRVVEAVSQLARRRKQTTGRRCSVGA